MQTVLLWSALTIGALGGCCCRLLSRARANAGLMTAAPTAFRLTAIGLPPVVWLATLPGRPPFASGHALGNGFLVGGVAALLAAWVAERALDGSEGKPGDGSAPVALMSMYTLGITPPAVALLFLRESLPDALLGASIGWFCVAMVLCAGLPGDRAGEDSTVTERSRRLRVVLIAGCSYAVLLCALALLGEYRGRLAITGASHPVAWGALGVAYAAMAMAALAVSSLPAGLLGRVGLMAPFSGRLTSALSRVLHSPAARAAAERVATTGVCLAALAAIAWLLSRKAPDARGLLTVLLLGPITGVLIWWLLWRDAHRGSDTRDGRSGTSVEAVLAAVLLLAVLMAAFQILAGVGMALALVGMLAVAGCAWRADLDAQALPAPGGPTSAATPADGSLSRNLCRLMTLGVVLVLYRVLETRFGHYLSGVPLTDHYAAFGFLLGALIPGALGDLLKRAEAARPADRLIRLVIIGGLVLLAPALLEIIWGAKFLPGLVIGLALSCVVGWWSVEQAAMAGVLALGMALAIAQWSGYVLPLAVLSRHERGHLLTWLVVVAAVVVVAAECARRVGSSEAAAITRAPGDAAR